MLLGRVVGVPHPQYTVSPSPTSPHYSPTPAPFSPSKYATHPPSPRDCRTEYEESCKTEYEQRCRTEYQDLCLTVNDVQCSTVREERCLQVRIWLMKISDQSLVRIRLLKISDQSQVEEQQCREKLEEVCGEVELAECREEQVLSGVKTWEQARGVSM